MAEPGTGQGLPGPVAHGCSAGPTRGVDRPLGRGLPPTTLLELGVCDITLWQWVTLWIRRVARSAQCGLRGVRWVSRAPVERHLGNGHRYRREHALRDRFQRQVGGGDRDIEHDSQSKRQVLLVEPSAR